MSLQYIRNITVEDCVLGYALLNYNYIPISYRVDTRDCNNFEGCLLVIH
jgi:hypothetical protein